MHRKYENDNDCNHKEMKNMDQFTRKKKKKGE